MFREARLWRILCRDLNNTHDRFAANKMNGSRESHVYLSDTEPGRVNLHVWLKGALLLSKSDVVLL